tara:strand:- start:641 stop:793 length:153 start_codon:yes stop_codon:yes gene_type:complete
MAEFIYLKKERYKDRAVKVGQIDSIEELKRDGWEEIKTTKPKKKKKKNAK